MAKKTKRIAKFTYDFSVDGGATGSPITPVINESLPFDAIVTNIITNEITAMTTAGGSATITLKCGSIALTTALAFDSGFTGGANTHVFPSSAEAVEITANGTLTLTIATAALTAGKVDWFVEYIY